MLTGSRKIVTVLLCGLAVVVITGFEMGQWAHAQEAAKPVSSEGGAPKWAAAAPGRVESRSREIKIAAPMIGRIAQVLVKANDKVEAGDPLVRLDDEEVLARIQAAEAQVALRKRARNDASTPRGAADRRKVEDAVADAEVAAFDAQVARDATVVALRTESGTEESVKSARTVLANALASLKQKQSDLRKVSNDDATPLPSRLEGELAVSRAELTVARTAWEKTRIRAPIAGTVLQVQAQPGELALPSTEQPLITLADLSSLRVRAELDERDIDKVKIGQHAVIRASAFPASEYQGAVASIAKIVGPSRISARGGQRRLSDVDVLDVVVDLTDPGPLVVGMQVDVYLSADGK
jgi:HlyD family secretion protein